MKSANNRSLVLIGSALALVLFIPGWITAQTTFGRIVVFGTSLSDPGNAFALTGEASSPPYALLTPDTLLVPGMPYNKGGHHFSNGATWVEQFARPLGLAGNTRPAFQGSDSKATNYAIGATRARDDGTNVSLSDQVNTFLDEFHGIAPPNALYVIEMGGNDVRDAFQAFASGGNGTQILGDALTAIGNNVGVLYAAGARRFLVWNAPDIGLTPALRTVDHDIPGAAAFASFVATGFNSNLDVVLGKLELLPGIEIAKLDVFQLIQQVVADPEAFGLTVADRACVMPNAPPYECKAADDYVFWDGVHPTAAMHAIVAQTAATVLAHP